MSTSNENTFDGTSQPVSSQLGGELDQRKKQSTCGMCTWLFTDARTAPCQHNFCFQCLVKNAKSDHILMCPTCSASIPTEKDKIEQFEPNRELNSLVGRLIRAGVYPGEYMKKNHENPCFETDPIKLDHAKFWKAVARSKDKREMRKLFKAHAEKHFYQHCFAECDNCRRKDYIGSSYVCGFCENYCLCEECGSCPKEQVHDTSHLFVKLKRQISKSVDLKLPPLMREARVMGNTLRRDSDVHNGVLEGIHSPIKCDNCRVEPIQGIRFKCGMCDSYNLCEKCEKKSEELHDRDHVFIVLHHPCKEPKPGRLLRVEYF